MLRGIDTVTTRENEQFSSKVIERLIETSLEHFANDDALVLAETYYSKVSSERSLLILAHCLTRARSFEGAYHLLKAANPIGGSTKSAKCRYLFAHCAFTINRIQEAEFALRDDTVRDKVILHPSFQNTASLPYAHSLLAKILCETNRVELAKSHWAQSVRQCPLLWNSIRSYCELGGESIKEHLQPMIENLATLKSTKNDFVTTETPQRKMEEGKDISQIFTPRSKTRTATIATERRRIRPRNVGSGSYTTPTNNPASTALRASENSPLTRNNKTNEDALKQAISPLIEAKQQEDEEAALLLEMSNKPVTRRAAAAAAAATREKTATIQRQQQMDNFYYEVATWLVQLAEVQENLSHFRCSTALQLLNKLEPQLSQLPLSLELHARIFFENGEYKRACQIFEEIRRLYPRRIQGMEIYSTALWQLRDPKKLSALTAEMSEVARDLPQTWCIAGNCFSLEKQHETAIECLERSIQLEHRFSYAYSLLGHELIDMNDLTRAAQAFRKAVQFSPNDYRAWYGLGLVHFKEEQLTLARCNLLRAVSINPTNTVLLCQLAVIEQAQQCSDSAMRYLERALEHSPNNVPCRFHKARLLFDTGHYEAARSELEELRVLSPDEAHVFFLLGRVNKKLGNTHMALLNFSWATEIDPRGEQNHSALTQDKGPYDDEPI